MDDTIRAQLNRALDEYIAQHYICSTEISLLADLFKEDVCARKEPQRRASRAKKRFAFRPKIAHRYARKENLPTKTLVVVMTDGEENSSRHYTNKKIQELVKRQEEKYQWEFMFIGTDIDAFASAENIGICARRAVPFSKDEDFFEACFDAVSDYACRIASVRARRVSDSEFDNIFAAFRKKK